jgi:hypothetical protein
LFSHSEAVVPRDVIEAHRDFDEHAIQGQKDIEHFVGIALTEKLMVQFAPLAFVRLGHWDHSAITDSKLNAGMEIETIDGGDRRGRTSVTP